MDFDAKFSFLQSLLGKGKYNPRTKESQFFCPFCPTRHHKPKLALNLNNEIYQCWVCGAKGNIIKLLKKVASHSDLQQYLDKFQSKFSKSAKNSEEIETFQVHLPEEYVPLIEYKNHLLGQKAYDYLLGKRGITEEDILKYKIGTAFRGNYANKIILPSFDSRGLVNFFTSRTYDGEYWSPSAPKGYKFSIIMNELNLDFHKPIVIVEGFFDMLKSVVNTVPLFGSSLPVQSLLFKTIVYYDTSVFIGLDPDAEKKSNNLMYHLLAYDILTYKIDVAPFKDIGELTKEQFLSKYQQATNISKNDILRSRIRNI